LDAVGDAVPPAERATRLASAAIWANGGFHLLMGERDGALTHAYYPKYATLTPAFAAVMRRYYDFVARYENVLSDRRLVTEPRDGGTATVDIAGHVASPLGIAGTIWTIRRSMSGFRTLSLINLSDASDTLWNAPKPAVLALHNLQIDFQVGAKVTSVFMADPDGLDTRPRPVAFTSRGEGDATRIRFELPRLDYWTLVVARVDDQQSRNTGQQKNG
jgi:dextranase